MRRQGIVLAISIGMVALALPFAHGAQQPECEWLAGDFHVHTVYSHDSWGGARSPDDNTDPTASLPGEPDGAISDAITLGWSPGQQGEIAESRQLDFIAITDHDDARAQEDPWSESPEASPDWGHYGEDVLPNPPGKQDLIWVPDYENTMNGSIQGGGGHAQMHGAQLKDFFEYEPQRLPADDPGFGPPLTVQETASKLHDHGGAYQINHPADMKWHDDDGNYEFPGWAPDSLEVWNIGIWGYQPPFPATDDHEFPLTMWDELLDQGFHVAGTGGSDNHWRSTTSVQGVGQPTTWVCVDLEQRNWQGIVDGVRANRTSISSQPPAYQGPRVFLYADDVAGEEGDDFESMIGDTVSPGSSVRVEVENAGGAMVRLVTNQEEPDPEHPTEDRTLATASVDSFAYSHDFEVPDWVHWLRVEVYYEDGREVRGGLRDLCNGFEEGSGQNTVYCDNRLVVVGMTSPIYFQTPEPEFDPATTLTYDGSTTVKVGSTATLAATLLDSAGAPLVNQPVRFTFRDKVYEATTDVAGHASVPVKVAGSPGTYDVISDFAGTDTYSASQDRDVLTVTSGSHK